jgi:gamma-glutamyltranspeptidase / glutathione hydrolase
MTRRTVVSLATDTIALASRRRPHAQLPISPKEAVVTHHVEATQAGLAVLRAGGNAFDAFIAATMAEYVVAEGATSLAGPLGVLVYDAKQRNVQYLDAEFNEVRQRRGRWKPGDEIGKAILVPGAPAGLDALSRRYGRLTFAECLAPAIRLAREGFPLNDLYYYHIELRTATLRSTDYGRRTFFRKGLSLEPGDILRQPELATLLKNLAKRGTSYMYDGPWAARFVKAARSVGGLIAMTDMESYRAVWHDPWRTTYRGHTLYACSGRTFGGLWTMLCLKALERVKLRPLGHWSESADALEILVRTVQRMWGEHWVSDYRLLEDREFVNVRLTSRYGARLWKEIQRSTWRIAKPKAGSHSYHIIVRDRDGNLASGTNTHESLGWGDGFFVDGVPLPASGYLPWGTRPGERRISPFSMILAFQNDAPRFATGSFSSSILEASLQFIVNLIDYRYSASEAATLPRLGTYPHNPADFLSAAGVERRSETLAQVSNWLDSRIPVKLVSTLERRGLSFVPDSASRRREEKRRKKSRARGLCDDRAAVDTGLGAVLAIGADGRAQGATVPWPRVSRKKTRGSRERMTRVGDRAKGPRS